MSAGEIVGAVFGTVFKVVCAIIVVIVVYRGSLIAYDYGVRVFAEEPISSGTGNVVTITVTDGKSAKEVGELLEENGLIRDAFLFQIQELLSEHHGELQAGIYELNTAMTIDEMMGIMAQVDEE